MLTLPLCSGVTFPAIYAMIARWAAPQERSRFTSFICAGGPFGTVIAMPASSYLCHAHGWQSVFYVFGALGCVWFLFWAVLIYDGPDLHPRISDREKTFIQVGDIF